MNTLISLAMAVLILLLYMRFEAGFLQIKRINLSNSKDGLKIIFLTDIHIEKFFISKKKLYSILKTENPDLIILGGDYLDYMKNSHKVISLFKGIVRCCTTIAVVGNHEYKSFENSYEKLCGFFDDIRKTGVNLLINKSTYIKHNNKKYKITGLDDIHGGNVDLDVINTNKTIDINILVCHNPDIIYKLPEKSVDYLLSGHIHGGQIRTPFKIEFTVLRDDKIYKDGIISGIHKMNGITLYISRGIGNTFLPFRFFARPELTIFNI